MRTLLFLISFCSLSLLGYGQNELVKLKADVARAERLKQRDSMAATYCRIGEYYSYRSSDTARYWFKKGLETIETKRVPLYTALLNNLSETYFSEGNVEEALKGYIWTSNECRRLKDTTLLISVLSAMGVVYRQIEKPDSALICYNQALRLVEKRDDWSEKANLLANIAIFYGNNSRFEEGIFYAKRAVKAAAEGKDMDDIMYANYVCGSLLFMQGKYDEGINMIRVLIAEAKRQKMPKFILKGYVPMLHMFEKLDDRDSIAYYLKEAENVLPLVPENSQEVLGLLEQQFQLLSKLGRYQESLEVQNKLLKYRGAGLHMPTDKLYWMMARNYRDMNDYAHAMEFYERAYQMGDSVHAEQVSQELSKLRIKYETQEKELEIAHLNKVKLEQEMRTMRWIIATIGVASAFLWFALYYLFRRKRLQKEQEYKLAQRYIEGLEKERSRLTKELHDGVCNDLLGIGMQMQCMEFASDERARMTGMLERVRHDVRNISHELMPPKFQYVTLMEAVNAFVEHLVPPPTMHIVLHSLNNENDWKTVPEHVAYEIYRVVQELLSNTIKHSEATEVNVELSIKGKQLTLLLSDNGKGYTDAVSSNGIGLNTIHERAKSINADYKLAESSNGRHEFSLIVPLS